MSQWGSVEVDLFVPPRLSTRAFALCCFVLREFSRDCRQRRLHHHLLEVVHDLGIRGGIEEGDGDARECERAWISPVSLQGVPEKRSQQYQPRLSSSARTTNTMGIILNILGHVVVDDERDILDINTSSSDVRCHEISFLSVLELSQRLFTLLLTFATVESCDAVLKT